MYRKGCKQTVLLLLGGLIWITNPSFANTKKDIPVILQTLNTVMETHATRKGLIWQNHGTGNYGEIIPLTKKQNKCRDYQRTWVFDEGIDTYAGTACLNENGIWKPTREKKTGRSPLTAKNDPLLIVSRRVEVEKWAAEEKRKAERQAKERAKREAAERVQQLVLAKIQAEADKARQKTRLAAEAREARLAAERKEQQEKHELQRLATAKKLAEEQKLKEALRLKANRAAKAAAKAKTKAKLKAERLRKETLARETAEREAAAKRRREYFVIGGGLASVLILIGLIRLFFRSQFWVERRALRQHLRNHSDAKTLYYFLLDTKTLPLKNGFAALAYLCFEEEQLEDESQALTARLSESPECLRSSQDAAESLFQHLINYQQAATLLSSRVLCQSWLVRQPLLRQWVEGVQETVVLISERLEKRVMAVQLFANITLLEPEIENRNLYLSGLPLDQHLDRFLSRSDEFSRLDADAIKRYTPFLSTLENTLARTNLPPIGDLADIANDLSRINEIKTILDLYNVKIDAIDQDMALDEDDKVESVEYLKRLRERDIAMLEGEA